MHVVWLGLWASKIVAHFLPAIFEFLMGVVSAGVRKYALVLKALEIPLSLVGWAIVSLATFIPVCTPSPAASTNSSQKQITLSVPTARGEHHGDAAHWQTVIRQILVAALISSCVFAAEKLLIQLISINYHRKQFNAKIKHSKHNIHLLSLLYDASRALFPAYCPEFAEEDYIINDLLQINLGSKKGTGHNRSGSATPLKLLHDVGRFGDKITSGRFY